MIFIGKKKFVISTIHQKNDITPLWIVNWLKQLPMTINKITLDNGREHSQNVHKQFNNSLRQTAQSKNRSENKITTGLLPNTRATDTLTSTRDVKNEVTQLNISAHLETLESWYG